MDIFEYAESINWSADYLDNHTGYIYKITEGSTIYNKEKIPVVDSMTGEFIGLATKNE